MKKLRICKIFISLAIAFIFLTSCDNSNERIQINYANHLITEDLHIINKDEVLDKAVIYLDEIFNLETTKYVYIVTIGLKALLSYDDNYLYVDASVAYSGLSGKKVLSEDGRIVLGFVSRIEGNKLVIVREV